METDEANSQQADASQVLAFQLLISALRSTSDARVTYLPISCSKLWIRSMPNPDK
jgi:hypothetical protein